MLDWSNSDKCVVDAVDPSTGAVSLIADYATVGCPIATTNTAIAFSPDFQKMALLDDRFHGTAGWMDPRGAVQKFGPDESHPEFGRAPNVGSVGFDKRGNFYYTVADEKGITYYRVPPGSTAQGEPVGTVADEKDSIFGPLPGGTFGLGSKVLFRETSKCVNSSSSAYDPDQQMYYYGDHDHGRIFKSPEWCPTSGDVIMSGINDGPDDVAVSPDGQKLMFTKLGSNPSEPLQAKYYVLSLSGPPSPVQVPVDPALAQAQNYLVVGWL